MAFERKETRVGSGPLTYFVGGSGEPLLYLHPAAGIGISKPLEALAGQSRTVYMPVTPGFDGTAPHDGLIRSMEALADLAASFINVAIGKRCDVIGASFGGWEALWLAVKHADKLDHLVLEAPAGLPAGGKTGLPCDPAEAAQEALRLSRPRAADDQADGAAPGQSPHARPLRRGIRSTDGTLAGRVDEITAPTLILMGTEDEIIPREAGRFLKANIPGSHLAYIYDAAHVIESDQPERFLRIVSSFLERGEAYIVNWDSHRAASARPGGAR